MRADSISLENTWKQRALAFRKETLPYVRYMFQSGLPAFLSLILISASIGYFSFIRNVPPNFPITATGVLSLMLALCWSPLRTWLAPADIVYMMPREREMGSYLRRSFRRTAVQGIVLGAIVLLLYSPIYNQGPGHTEVSLLSIAAVLIKAGNVWGSWRERQMAWPSMRIMLRLVRWLLSAAALTAWLTCVLWQAAAFTLLIALTLLFMYRLPQRHRLPWDRLIEEEQATRKRYYTLFGMFIDVPTLSSTIHRRSYLSWMLRLIPYSHRNTYSYLYTAALLRTELGGMMLRMLLLGCLVTYWAAEAAAWSGWGAALVFAFFLAVMAVQLSGLRHVHRHSVWKHVYPLPEKQRHGQLIKVDRIGLLICAFLLWLPLILPLAGQGIYAPSMASLLGTLLYAGWRAMRLRVKLTKEADED